jgi:hydrogenase maturation factor
MSDLTDPAPQWVIEAKVRAKTVRRTVSLDIVNESRGCPECGGDFVALVMAGTTFEDWAECERCQAIWPVSCPDTSFAEALDAISRAIATSLTRALICATNEMMMAPRVGFLADSPDSGSNAGIYKEWPGSGFAPRI